MIERFQLKVAIIKAAVVLIPSYSAAYLTDKMIYVVPTLAAASFFAASLNLQQLQTSRRVDDDSEDDDGTEFQDFDT